MTLPAGHARHLVHRCPLGQTQHRNHHILLGGGLRVGLRLGVRQGLDCRPQLIDQRVAVANLLSLFDAGQSIPQRQQALGAERGRVQLLVRCNGNLAVVDCCRRSAAQRDPVVADYINAHKWGAPDRPGGGSAVTPLTLSSPTKASLFPIILWRCWAGSEHGITQPRPHDLRWVVRRAAGPKPSPQQAEYCCHPASRLRSFRSARSSSGSPLLEVDPPRRWRAGTAGDDPNPTLLRSGESTRVYVFASASACLSDSLISTNGARNG